MEKAVPRIFNDPLGMLRIFFLIAMFVNLYELVPNLFEGQSLKNAFFPKFLMEWNMALPYLLLGVLIFMRNKIAYFSGMAICIVLTLHPVSFGRADLVIAFYLFLWLFAKDDKHSIFLGRLLVSFIFFGATLGKLTPGWWSGEQLYNIVHLRNVPNTFLVIFGEFLLTISFLLPLGIASLISICILIGMSISMTGVTILQATLPLLGMVLAFLSIKYLTKDTFRVYFCTDSKKSSFLYEIFDVLKLNSLELVKLDKNDLDSVKIGLDGKRYATIQGQNREGQYFYGPRLWGEIIGRTPLFAFLTPLIQFYKKVSTGL